MENQEKMMTGEDSLKIIKEMINKTQVNIRQGSFHLLFWGWLIVLCSLSEYLLYKFTNFEEAYLVWLLVIPGVLVSLVYGYIVGRKAKVYTYADMINMWTWIGFLIAMIILFVIQSNDMGSVAPYILMLAGLPTFVSGIILKFRPLVLGGISFWLFALLANFTGPSVSPLAVPLAMLTGYLIPGYMLKRKVDYDSI